MLIPDTSRVNCSPRAAFRARTAALAALLCSAPAFAQSPASQPQAPAAKRAFGGVQRIELAGKPIPKFPHYQWVRAYHEGDRVYATLDPTRVPLSAAVPTDVYIVAARTKNEWLADNTLTDVRGAPKFHVFSNTSIVDNTFVVDEGVLNGDAGTGLGVAYDLVLDVNRNGLLDSGDAIDGAGAEAGFYVLRDPSLPGPLDVTQVEYSGGGWLGQRTYYPTDIASMGQLPLVVVSHGNGHNYRWYDHIGFHIASYGYVVMSHQNQTQPGIDTASRTTLTNTDYILANQSTIAGGVLDGHLDGTRMTWIGHSRGGEGVVRAYNKVETQTGSYIPTEFTHEDIALVSSIAPVTFLDTFLSHPGDVNYHLLFGGGDTDVTGSPANILAKPFALYERAQGNRHATYLHGVGHAWFHDGGGPCVCTGPARLDRPQTHEIMLGYYLALIKLYVEGNVPARDYFERMYLDFHPPGIGSHVQIASESKPAEGPGVFIVDDYQNEDGTHKSTSGGVVSYNVRNVVERKMRDNDSSFVAPLRDRPMNGMTRSNPSEPDDNPRCAVFDWSPILGIPEFFYKQEVMPEARDFTQFEALSFRACQGTRHRETTTLNGPLTFSVSLVDGQGGTSTIDFRNYGAITFPYQRGGFGVGNGWGNEFNTVRLRITDFIAAGGAVDLTDIRSIVFEFSTTHGSPRGRIGLDDILLIRKEAN